MQASVVQPISSAMLTSLAAARVILARVAVLLPCRAITHWRCTTLLTASLVAVISSYQLAITLLVLITSHLIHHVVVNLSFSTRQLPINRRSRSPPTRMRFGACSWVSIASANIQQAYSLPTPRWSALAALQRRNNITSYTFLMTNSPDNE